MFNKKYILISPHNIRYQTIVIIFCLYSLIPKNVYGTEPVQKVSDHRFVMYVDGHKLTVPFYYWNPSNSDSPFDQSNDVIKRAVIVIHGSGRYPGEGLPIISNPAAKSGATHNCIAIAPQFLIEDDIIYHNLEDNVAFWSDYWRRGSFSISTDSNRREASISSYEVVDRICERLADRSIFPSLDRVIVIGHSAGGGFVNRYAASSKKGYEILRAADIAMRFIACNAGYVYFSPYRRVDGTVDQFEIPSSYEQSICTGYNEYAYGLENLYGYVANVGAVEMLKQYPAREVIYLAGSEDNNPDANGLSDSCGSVIKGDHRLEYGIIYFNHLQHTYGPSILAHQRFGIVQGVPHNSSRMFGSRYGKRYLFDYEDGLYDVLRVDAEAISDPNNDGSTWDKAFSDLSKAISYAARTAGDVKEIWVANGVYTPDSGTGDQTLYFQLLNNVKILGGFAGIDSIQYPGGEIHRDQRDPSVNQVILSGDLHGNDVTENEKSDNSFQIVSTKWTDNTAILDGVYVDQNSALGGNIILKVDVRVSAGGHGLTWDSAMNDLHKAIEIAKRSMGNVKEIWVAEGIYTPSSEGLDNTCDATFSLPSGVAIYGGFPTGGGEWEDRDPKQFETILNGDLAGDDTEVRVNDNCYHVATAFACDESTILNGFVITGGNANGEILRYARGGALLVIDGALLVRSCVFSNNYAKVDGGAIYLVDSDPCFIDCSFFSNNSDDDGGAIYVDSSNVYFESCIFNSNRTSDKGGSILLIDSHSSFNSCQFISNQSRLGGAVVLWGNSNSILHRCSFKSNFTTSDGGAVYSHESNACFKYCSFMTNFSDDDGGVVANWSAVSIFTSCKFLGNRADDKGGVFFDNSGESSLSDASFINCLFVGNHAKRQGGVFANYANNTVNIWNSSLVCNVARYGSIAYRDQGSLNFINCLVWGNINADKALEGNGIQANYCCLQENHEGDLNIYDDPSLLQVPNHGGDGWTDDPHTVDDDEGANDYFGDVRILPTSPCINRGTLVGIPNDLFDLDADGIINEGIPLDIDNNVRVCGGKIDIGAYEYCE